MFPLKKLVICTLSGILFQGCSKSASEGEPSLFKTAVSKPLASDFPGEVSGMADSYSRPGFIWLIQDKDNQASLLSVSHEGQAGPELEIVGAVNQDWEDMAIGKGPVAGKKYLYIADAGDNFSVFDTYYIYRFPEPEPSATVVDQYDKIAFRYEDGLHHNTEAVLVENSSGNIVLITKESPAQVFEIKASSITNGINTAEKLGQLNIGEITGAALSPDGTEILLRTYSNLYYWKKNAGESILSGLQKNAVTIAVQTEPQGEAVAFKNDQGGFFTLSENAGLPLLLKLYYYSRN